MGGRHPHISALERRRRARAAPSLPTHTAREIGERLGRSRSAIKNKALKLGLGNGIKSHNADASSLGWSPNKGTRFIAGGRSAEIALQDVATSRTRGTRSGMSASARSYLQRKVTDTGVTRRDYRPSVPPGLAGSRARGSQGMRWSFATATRNSRSIT